MLHSYLSPLAKTNFCCYSIPLGDKTTMLDLSRLTWNLFASVIFRLCFSSLLLAENNNLTTMTFRAHWGKDHSKPDAGYSLSLSKGLRLPSRDPGASRMILKFWGLLKLAPLDFDLASFFPNSPPLEWKHLSKIYSTLLFWKWSV